VSSRRDEVGDIHINTYVGGFKVMTQARPICDAARPPLKVSYLFIVSPGVGP
jgi:hypothetical protein